MFFVKKKTRQEPMGQPRNIRRRTEKFQESVRQTGSAPPSKREEKNNGLGVGPVVVGFILFVVIGSSILQLVRSNL